MVTADNDLIRRDPALPGLAAVLAMEGVNYLRYKPGTNCLVAGSFGYAKTYRGDPAVKVFKFPDDAELDLAEREHIVAKMLPELAHGTLTTLAYRPERRYVARLDTERGPQAVIKFYDEGDFARAYANSKHFHTPRIGRSRRHRVLAYDWLLGDALTPPHFAAAGAALAKIHAHPVTGLARWTGTDNLRELAAMLGFLCPSLAARAERLATELSVTVEPTCAIHGDFYARQVLITDAGIALLDFDQAAAGEPAIDLGNFLAHCELDDLPVEALLEGYGSRPARVDLFTALGLFRLAHEPFRRREPDWPERIAAIVERAELALHRSKIGRVLREKSGRRRLVEYEGDLLGKIREKGVDNESYRVQRALWEAGLPVPEPVAIVPGLKMWLQRRVPGVSATELLAGLNGIQLAKRIAEVIHQVHQAGILTKKRHTMADELRILHERLPERKELLTAAERLAATLPELEYCPIHRDFYADQVLVDGDRLWLVDFDLYCMGDPGLDVGNFVGHMTEYALRKLGGADALADREAAMLERFGELAGPQALAAARVYALLTLVRHVHISTLFTDRQPFTEQLAALCAQRLAVR